MMANNPVTLFVPPTIPQGQTGVRSERASESGSSVSGGVDVSWLPLPVQALDFAPNPFGAKPRRGQGVRVSMPSFFRLPISKENLWKAEDLCTEPTFGTTPSVFFNTITLTTNSNQGAGEASCVIANDRVW